MGMTITQKILAAHAGLDEVKTGQLITAKTDIVLSNDITGPVAIREMIKVGITDVFDKDRIAMIPDHFSPTKDIKSAEQCKTVRDFAKAHDLKHYYEVGKMGIEHCLLPEQGIVGPGDLIIGADSHTCTYGAVGAFATGMGSTDIAAGMISGETWLRVPEAIKGVVTGKPTNPWISGKDVILYLIGKIGVDGALYKTLEFTGDGVQYLSMDSRLTICNMAIEAGAKNGIFEVDDITREYVKGRLEREMVEYHSDPDAEYCDEIVIDLSTLQPQVAFPHLPSNTKEIGTFGDVEIDQVVIGSCTNGRIQDLRVAAAIMDGKKVAGNVRCVVIPATQEIMLQAVEEGLVKIFIEAGAAVSTPTCGPCLGGHMGVMAEGERAVSTTNRNFVGRMGHVTSEIILASPAVAAASAIAGCVADPRAM